jgi:hypothetical protein
METVMASQKSGRDLASWCNEIGCTRAFIYGLPENQKPRTVKIGRRRFVLETPQEYLERMAATQTLEAA